MEVSEIRLREEPARQHVVVIFLELDPFPEAMLFVATGEPWSRAIELRTERGDRRRDLRCGFDAPRGDEVTEALLVVRCGSRLLELTGRTQDCPFAPSPHVTT